MLNRLIAIVAILALTVGYAVFKRSSLDSQLAGDAEATSVLAKMPSGIFETLDGKEFNPSTLEAKLTVVHFWATWCVPCEAELPALMKLIQKYETSGAKFLLVAVNDDLVKIKKQIEKMRLKNSSSITWLIDNKDIHRNVYGTTRVPETYVFSSDKVTLRKFVGPQTWDKESFFQTFDEFLESSSHKL